MFPLGIYEEIINEKLKEYLSALDHEKFHVTRENLDVEEARKVLSNYISIVTRKALNYVRDAYTEDRTALLKQIHLCNEIIKTLSKQLDAGEYKKLQIDEEGQVLHSISSKLEQGKVQKKQELIRPITSIAESSLFTGSNVEPNMVNELKKEILSADEIDFLVSFIRWSGIRLLYDELKEFTINGGILRIISTSYMGATQYKAIKELAKLPNTKIKISYDTRRTRLHAKAYMFKRNTGFTTAYIGSSNLSYAAMTSGLEWNIKITEKDSFDIIKKFTATFEGYWNVREFETFDVNKQENRERLQNALKPKTREKGIQFALDIRPYHYQEEILEQLQVERQLFNRHKNLLVAATGVGKTVISAFDYARYRKENDSARLLFIAHREEILKQSLSTFRAVLKDFNFGELFVGDHVPDSYDNLFISIQTFHSKRLEQDISEDYYDFIIVDEFHHAAANSYKRLLHHFKPKILLGLTGTPERMDGKDILNTYFDGRIASEMRLPEAINRKLLSPFHYFCVSDTVDLSQLKWSRGGYQVRELENVYTNNHIRSNQIIKSLYKYVSDIEEVKGLGFCVSVEHAKYMANYFNKSNIPSIALHGNSDRKIREQAKEKLVRGDIHFIFVVDIYNEGVDIPDVNTILFLRPTESLTIFLQQLGRGLRLSENKECLTVLDFVGQAHKNYNFEEKFRALVGPTKKSIEYSIDEGFSNLPRGSFIQLERQAKEYILRNLRAATNNKRNLLAKLKTFQENTNLPLTFHQFLNYHQLTLHDFYGRNGNRLFERMLVEGQLAEDFSCKHEQLITRRIHKLFHLNSYSLLDFLIQLVEQKGFVDITTKIEKLMLNMFYYSFFQREPKREGFSTVLEAVQSLLTTKQMQREILAVLNFNFQNIQVLEKGNQFSFETPLSVHCTYTSEQVMAALGYYCEEKRPSFREGVKYFEELNLDIFFTTLNKSEKEFSPSTMYESYAISEDLFHWQSQSTVTEQSPTAQRYIHHKKQGHKIGLFVREYRQDKGYTSPFIYLGTCNYVKHEGEKPVSFIWKLDDKMPPSLFEKANKSIGGL